MTQIGRQRRLAPAVQGHRNRWRSRVSPHGHGDDRNPAILWLLLRIVRRRLG